MTCLNRYRKISIYYHASITCVCLYLGSCINKQVFACGVLLNSLEWILPDERTQSTAGKWAEVRNVRVTPTKHTQADHSWLVHDPQRPSRSVRGPAPHQCRNTHTHTQGRVEVHHACWLKLATQVWSSYWVRETLTDSSCWNDLIPTGFEDTTGPNDSSRLRLLTNNPNYPPQLTAPTH